MPRRVHHEPFILRPPDDLIATRPDLVRMADDLARAYRRMGADFDAAAGSRERGSDAPGGIAVVSDDGLRAIGGALWNTLVAADPTLPERLEAARAVAGTYILPLVIESGSAAVHRLPWETLHHPTFGFLGLDNRFALSRRFPGPAAAHPPDRGPLRVALFTCLPDDVDPERGRLDVEEQQAQALQALGEAVVAGRVTLEMPDDGRFSTFERLVREVDPHVVFLFAHGKFRNEPGRTQPPQAIIQFEDEHGGSDLVGDEKLAAVFSGSGTRAVIQAACESGMGDSTTLAMGLAGAISRAGVPHVLGMRESVLARAGIVFNAAFADAIVGRERADVAAQLARSAITRPLAGVMGLDEPAAELSLGQWPLPALIAPDPAAALIDWAFTPLPPSRPPAGGSLGEIPLPPRFIGRRSELRDRKAPLLRGERPVLLISGVGGRGKTALAGKIAADWEKVTGREAAVWSAREGATGWDAFYLGLIRRAGEAAFRQATADPDGDARQAEILLQLLLRREDGRLLVFLDNLETVQDPATLAFNDDRVAAFVAAARAMAEAGTGLRLLLTTRGRPPGWPEAAWLALGPVTFSDFLQLALARRAPAAFWQPGRARRIYRTMDGNARGLEIVAGALATLDDPTAEKAFLARLEEAESTMRLDMALAALAANLDGGARALLARLPAYETAVPLDGIRAVAPDRPDIEAALDRLAAVGLVERYEDHLWQTTVYRVASVAAAWLAEQPGYALDPAWLRAAAGYQVWLYRYERPTLEQAIILHRALTRAGEQAAADRLALGDIVRPLDRAGLYRTLLDDWLPAIRESADGRTRAAGLGWSGTCSHARGDYAGALSYLEQSLAISREIGDRAGEGTTLNNLATTAHARGDYAGALSYLEQSLAIRREIGDRAGEGTTLNNISGIYQARGDYAGALSYLEQSLAISREIGDRAGEGTTLNNLATTAHARGDYAGALSYLEQSLAIRREIGDRAGEGTTLNNISGIYHARGDYAGALSYLEQSLAIRREIGDASGLCVTLFNMGHIYWQNGRQGEALGAWVMAYQIADRIGYAQVLAALEELAGSIGLPGGLAGWAALAGRMGEG